MNRGMEEPVQKSLERYDVLDRIAVGGMAEAFLAKAYGAHGFEKTLAIKRILPELASDPEFEDRFIAEAKVAVKLSHNNVVQVFDFGRFSGSLFIAMEYVDGLDLAALLRRLRDRGMKMPVAAAFQIAIELARGLDFAHTHGVVHRDVSPSNILLSRAGEVKIADFGIAVAAQPQRTPDVLLAASQLVVQLNTIVSRRIDPAESAVLSVTRVNGGSSHNVLPAEATVTGTVRSFDAPTQDRIEAALRDAATGMALAHGVETEVTYHRYYPATVNISAGELSGIVLTFDNAVDPANMINTSCVLPPGVSLDYIRHDSIDQL
jgi:serine/threonine protein kinase